ncbi:hypothetical protein PVE_R2G0394 [Pseudomonas veronii 1YdBTEX2]|uniref:Uncharacterized protein n=1 Tax=Pseudomonas veronii 1YdBTEX2 TaxID=1295141 RepID=A0A1D3K8B1_PSEVE|nr:hypothetical protein PVE_R2G0394 [Pseudomonas veronii 1YdBTEX2]
MLATGVFEGLVPYEKGELAIFWKRKGVNGYEGFHPRHSQISSIGVEAAALISFYDPSLIRLAGCNLNQLPHIGTGRWRSHYLEHNNSIHSRGYGLEILYL